MQQLAPDLWDILGLLLSANSREAHHCVLPDADGNVPMREPNVLTPEEELWKEVEDFFPGDDESIEEGPTVKADPNRMVKRREALITIVSMRALMFAIRTD